MIIWEDRAGFFVGPHPRILLVRAVDSGWKILAWFAWESSKVTPPDKCKVPGYGVPYARRIGVSTMICPREMGQTPYHRPGRAARSGRCETLSDTASGFSSGITRPFFLATGGRDSLPTRVLNQETGLRVGSSG